MNQNSQLKRYVAYGSNINTSAMQQRCPTAKPIGVSQLQDYALDCRGEQHGMLTIVKKAGASLPVLLWEISPEDESALDIYEQFPILYRKEWMKLAYNGVMIDAFSYIMNDGYEQKAPLKNYMKVVKEGYAEFSFDPTNIDHLFSTLAY